MTMHDDSGLDLVERDLHELARARTSDEELRVKMRALLAADLEPTHRRRPALRFALPAAAALAAAVLAAIALAGIGGSGGPGAASAAVLHHALRVVTPPPGTILHVKVMSLQNGRPFVGEWWQQTEPPYASRGMKGTLDRLIEFGDDGTTSFEYDPSTNTIYEQPDTAAPTFTDPISSIEQELANGHAQLEGTAVIGGESLYKIDLPNQLTAYFDETSYSPRYLDDPQRNGSVVRLTVVAYEHLAPTAENMKLLSIPAQHADAAIDTNPNDRPVK